MFLTGEQLVELTGYKRASLQIERLRVMGVKHYIRRDGRPVVVAADLAPRPVEAAVTGPDFTQARRSA